MNGAHTAAVDADFIIHISAIKLLPQEIVTILDKVLCSYGIQGVIHPLVYDKELNIQDAVISKIFSDGVIQRLTFENHIFQSDVSKEAYYRYLVSELYHRLTGNTLPEDQDILTYWKRQSSLGEIHSVAMCLICQFGIFLSDDNDSKFLKKIVERNMFGKIEIYNRKDILDQCTSKCGLSRSERRAFAHQT